MFKTAEEVLDYWILKANSFDVDAVVALYHPKAVLIPVFSNRILNNHEAIRIYFEQQRHRRGLNVNVKGHETMTQKFGNNIHCIAGVFCWRFSLEGKLADAEARFSFMLDLAETRPIFHHHSSRVPTKLFG